MVANKSAFFFTFLVVVITNLYLVQIHGLPLNEVSKVPVILNAELKVVGKDEKGNLIFDDLTNHLENIHKDGPYYEDYLHEHMEQEKFIHELYDTQLNLIFGGRLVLHPKTVESFKRGTGPVFAMDRRSTGPIGADHSLFKEFKETFPYLLEETQYLVSIWNQIKATRVSMIAKPRENTVYHVYPRENGRSYEVFTAEGHPNYNLFYYRYLITNPEKKATIQQDLAAFEAKIKERNGFQNAVEGGVELCNENVPRVYCSPIFKFLGQIDSSHPYFDQYDIHYRYERGDEGTFGRKEEVKKEVKQEVKEEPKVETVPEQLLKELPFHRLDVITESANILKVIDLDDKNQEFTKNHKYFKYYEEVARAQWNQKKERLEKRARKEIPILVFELPGKHPKYVEQTEEGAVLRQIHFGNPDYEFAEWSHKEVQKINEQLNVLKAELEKGKVQIEAKVRDLSVTPIFRINRNPEEIPYQDPRYELIRFYHLKNLRKRKGRYQQRK